jgi:hypothetical protein
VAQTGLKTPQQVTSPSWTTITYYDDLAASFGLTIERAGPFFGSEHLLEVLARSSTIANLVGEGTRHRWPDRYDLRRIPIRDPTPVYPQSLIWPEDNTHPALGSLRSYFATTRTARPTTETWAPAWARP